MVVLIAALVGAWGNALAQEQPLQDWLVMYHYGDFWFANEQRIAEPTYWDGCGTVANGETPVSPIIMSPNGDHLVYLNYPVDFKIELLTFAGPPPTVIRLCNGIDLAESMVAGQPADFNITDLDAVNYVSHSTPAWSPDSTKLAWTAVSHGGGDATYELVVFDIATNHSQVIATEFPAQFGVAVPLQVAWGTMGIVVMSQTFVESSGTVQPELLIYAKEGQLLNTIAVPESEEIGYFRDFVLADNAGEEVIVVFYTEGFQNQLNPGTGEFAPLEGVLQLYAPDAPPESLSLNFSYSSSLGGQEPIWELNALDGTKTRLEYFDPPSAHSIGISPSGQMIAYAAEQVFVWSAGQVQIAGIPTDSTIDPNTSLAWSPLAWRIVPGGYG